MRAGMFILMTLLFLSTTYANDNVLNIYVWYNEIPTSIIKKFEAETGIHVNYADYNDNEVLYAKLNANPNSGYDIIEPSSYYVARMSQEGMLQALDKEKLVNFDKIDEPFRNPSYDPDNRYSIPYLTGVTGIFVNKAYYNPNTIDRWKNFWDKRYENQLMLLNDPREVFSMGLLSLGLSPNTSNAQEIKAAYTHLLALMPNVKLFNSDAIPSIFIDADATIGMAWNGDVFRAQKENKDLIFIYPKDGFVIWVDCMAIPKNAPHPANAYRFLNFLMEPQNAALVTLLYGYATPNKEAKEYLPKAIQHNPTIFPGDAVLKRGTFQTNIDNQALRTYAKYWELLKLNA